MIQTSLMKHKSFESIGDVHELGWVQGTFFNKNLIKLKFTPLHVTSKETNLNILFEAPLNSPIMTSKPVKCHFFIDRLLISKE